MDPSVEDDDERVEAGWERVIIMAVTNFVDDIPDCLQRPGRSEREVVMCMPDSGERFELLSQAGA